MHVDIRQHEPSFSFILSSGFSFHTHTIGLYRLYTADCLRLNFIENFHDKVFMILSFMPIRIKHIVIKSSVEIEMNILSIVMRQTFV